MDRFQVVGPYKMTDVHLSRVNKINILRKVMMKDQLDRHLTVVY